IFRAIARYLARLAYVTGLTALIPLVVIQTHFAPRAFTASIALVGIAILIMLMVEGSFGQTVKRLGLMTFVPGILAILFILFGKEVILMPLVDYFPAVGPAIAAYLERTVPSVTVLAISFFVIGFILWRVGSVLTKKEFYAARIKEISLF
ncbi:MAG: hypothetical protein QXU88_02255, partial [Candidatus Woesearchaeota archaeon]